MKIKRNVLLSMFSCAILVMAQAQASQQTLKTAIGAASQAVTAAEQALSDPSDVNMADATKKIDAAQTAIDGGVAMHLTYTQLYGPRGYLALAIKILDRLAVPLSSVGLGLVQGWDEGGYKSLRSTDYGNMAGMQLYDPVTQLQGRGHWNKYGINEPTSHRTIKFSNGSGTKSYMCNPLLREPSAETFAAWKFGLSGYNSDPQRKDRVDTTKYGPVKHFKDYGLGEGRWISIISPAGKTYTCTPVQ